MGNMIVDAAQKQVYEKVSQLQGMIDAGGSHKHIILRAKRAILSVDALKAALKAL